ncbi:hypothetical protein OG948_25445 [Embleya sp. NBC_00888]|uniref:hypothetical protein n=1 Tax=Embleya sp. NBC_00888 TaxID=2975960 RepID=UPI0038638A61|nr:hypothetical protein OG948_25445 [Embleya sp. NBC_00888]
MVLPSARGTRAVRADAGSVPDVVGYTSAVVTHEDAIRGPAIVPSVPRVGARFAARRPAPPVPRVS